MTKNTKWNPALGCYGGESGLWAEDAIERQMSHTERNGVRAAYIHTSEHLEERRLMVQWWADYLDANRDCAITPYEFARTKNVMQSPFNNVRPSLNEETVLV